MFGRKEIVEMVGGVQSELEAVRNEIAMIVGTMKTYYEKEREEESRATSQRMKVMEQRMNRRFDEVVKAQSSSVMTAMDKREENKERKKLRGEIISSLSLLYAKENETELFEETKRGAVRLTKEGDKFYKLLSETVLKIAKYLGHKTHSKIAKKETYEEFRASIGVTGDLTKKSITMNNGKNRKSVYADLIQRGIVGKFTKFLESEFLNENEANPHA